MRTTTPLCYRALPSTPALRHGTGTIVPSGPAVVKTAIPWSVALRRVQSLVLHFCKHSSPGRKLKAVSVGCQGRLRQCAVDHLPHVSFRLISGMPSLASEHNQCVHYYTPTGWNVLSAQMHFGMPVLWASFAPRGRGGESIRTILLTGELPNVGRGHGMIHRYLFSVTKILNYSRGTLLGWCSFRTKSDAHSLAPILTQLESQWRLSICCDYLVQRRPLAAGGVLCLLSCYTGSRRQKTLGVVQESPTSLLPFFSRAAWVSRSTLDTSDPQLRDSKPRYYAVHDVDLFLTG